MIYNHLHYSPVDAAAQPPAQSLAESRAELHPPTTRDILLTMGAPFHLPSVWRLQHDIKHLPYSQAQNVERSIQPEAFFRFSLLSEKHTCRHAQKTQFDVA